MGVSGLTQGENGRAAAPREDWLDAIRGLAVLGMVETHAVNTLLAAEWREGEGFSRLMYANGLVAPAFLWIAGYAQGLGARRRQERGIAGWPVRTLRRLILILLLGFLIHLPMPGTGATWRLFFGIDVLQCLAASLLGVVALQHWLPRHQGVGLAAAALLAIATGALPAAALNDPTGFWPLDAWFDQSGSSLFPLVPWAAFVFLGVLMARWPSPLWVWPALGAVLLALPSPPFISKSHPTFFAERLGWLLLVVAAVQALGRTLRFPRWLLFAGRESLAIYLVHLALLYLVPTARWVGPQLAPGPAALAALGLAVISIGLAWGWRTWRSRRRESAG